MEETISIFIQPLDNGGLSSRQILELARWFPELSRDGKNGKEIELLRAKGDDERAALLITHAQEVGIDVFSNNSQTSGFSVVLRRIYEDSEMSACSHLDFCNAGGIYLGEVDYPPSHDSNGIPVLAGVPRQKSLSFGNPEPVHPSFFVVRGDAKEKMENAGFKGLQLLPVNFKRARHPGSEDPLWAVWSDLVMPSVKNLFRNDLGKMGFADEVAANSDGLALVDGFLSPPELHYERKEVDIFGDFDVALMREHLKVRGTFSRRPIFSQRFRRFVIDEIGVPFMGIPVRIDDDDLIPWEGPYPSNWSHLNRRPEWLEKLQAEISTRTPG